MTNRQHVLHYRSSGTTLPPALLPIGELAISTNNDNPRIYFKKSNDEFAQFVDKEYVDKKASSLIFLDFEKLQDFCDYEYGDFGEIHQSGTTSGDTVFYEFLNIDDTETEITAREYYDLLNKSNVYFIVAYDGVIDARFGVDDSVIDEDKIITLNIHGNRNVPEGNEGVYDIKLILDFEQKTISFTILVWPTDATTAAKPVLIEVALSTEVNESGDTITTYQLKKDGENIKPKDIFAYEQQGFSVMYFSYKETTSTDPLEQRRPIWFYRAEASEIENRINLFMIETDSHSDIYTPGLTFFNFDSTGKIAYNSTKDYNVSGRVESLDFLREINNTDGYLKSTSKINGARYEIDANTVDIDDAIIEDTVIGFANVYVSIISGSTDLREHMLCAGATTAFHGGLEYYYFMDETGSLCVKTADILNGNTLYINKEVQVYEYDQTTHEMYAISGETLHVSSFEYVEETVALADVVDVKKHINAKQDKLTAGAGVEIDENNKISISSDVQAVALKLSVDLAENATLYQPYPYNMTSEEAIQNGFVVVPETMNLAEWYAADNKTVLLDIKDAAKEKIFGELLSSIDGIIACTSFSMNDDNMGPQYVFSYSLHAGYIDFRGWISIDQYETSEGSGVVTYSFAFNPFYADPIEVIAVTQEDGSYVCQVTQTTGYCEEYIQGGGRTIKFIKRPIKGNDSIPDYVLCDNAPTNGSDYSPYWLIGRVASITDAFIEGTIIVTYQGTAAYMERECALKSDISGMVKSVNGITADTNGNVEISVGGGMKMIEGYDLFYSTLTLLPEDYDEYNTKSATFDLSGATQEDRVNIIKAFFNVDTLPTFDQLKTLLSENVLKIHLTEETNAGYAVSGLEIKDDNEYVIKANVESGDEGNYEIAYTISINDDATDGDIITEVKQFKRTLRESVNDLMDGSKDSAYFKEYDTMAEYEADTTRQTPNVCTINETGEIIYNN